jgi:hypothetical protein
MFENICIYNYKINKHRTSVVVFDGDSLIHKGSRPIDHVFAANVQKTLEERGYEAACDGVKTEFRRP